MIYKRNCPKCNSIIEYKNPRSFKWADRDGKVCRGCYSKTISATIKDKFKNGDWIPKKRNKENEKTLERNYHRNCPKCENKMNYASKGILERAIKENTMCNKCSTIVYKKGIMNGVTKEQVEQMRATKAGFQNFDEYKQKYPKKQFYKREVWRLTYQKPIDTLENWKLRGRCGVEGAYQLDHIRSIDWGWKNGIDAEVIAEWDNLRMIPWKTNLLKSSK